MATDTEKTPANRLNEIRRQWGLQGVDEATAQAQNRALPSLEEWLRSGVESPEVVVRAVQVLLLDPELSGAEHRQALGDVVQQVSGVWANAGAGQLGILGLQAMLLAAWPRELRTGGFALTPLLDSTWTVVKGRERYRGYVEGWRASVLQFGTSEGGMDASVEALNFSAPAFEALPNTSGTSSHMEFLRRHTGQNFYYSNFGTQLVSVLDAHSADLKVLAEQGNTLVEALGDALVLVHEQVNAALTGQLRKLHSESTLLWWGQARYSKSLRKPYRRLKSDERLWWMAWEASELATQLEAEPAASFLVETLHQLGDDITQKRPLKQWVHELVDVLRRAERPPVTGERLSKLASDDALGLPVTWARLEAANLKSSEATRELRAREAIAVDLDTEIDRGAWVAWLFRESLLDRHLGGR